MRATTWLLFAIYAANYLDRQIFSVLLEPIRRDLGLSDLEMGLLSGFAFSVVYGVVTIPAALWAAAGNRRNLVAISAIFWGAMTVFCGLAASFWQMFSARAAVAFGEAGAVPGAHSILSDTARPENRVRAFGNFVTGSAVGGLLAVLVGGVIGQAHGWRVAMVCAGVIGIVPGLLLFLVPEPRRDYSTGPEGVPWHPRQGLATVRETAAAILRNPAARLVFFGEAVNHVVLAGAVAWYPAFLNRLHGFTSFEAAATASAGGLLAIAGTLLSSRLIARMARRERAWLAWGAALVILAGKPFSVVFLLSDHPVLFLAAFVVPAALSLSTLAPTISLLHEAVTPAQRPMASALLVSLGTVIGLGCGPALVGWMSSVLVDAGEASLRFALVGLQLIGLIAAALYGMAGFRQYRRAALHASRQGVGSV